MPRTCRRKLRATVAAATRAAVGVTPAAGFVGPMGAIAIGVAAGLACMWFVVVMKSRMRIDDSLDVFGIHGVGGIVGAMLMGADKRSATEFSFYLAIPTMAGAFAYDLVFQFEDLVQKRGDQGVGVAGGGGADGADAAGLGLKAVEPALGFK